MATSPYPNLLVAVFSQTGATLILSFLLVLPSQLMCQMFRDAQATESAPDQDEIDNARRRVLHFLDSHELSTPRLLVVTILILIHMTGGVLCFIWYQLGDLF